MASKLRVALIWPKSFDPGYGLPLVYGYLKSNLDSDKYTLKLFDCAFHNISSDSPVFREKLADFNPDIVGVSCWSFNYLDALGYLRAVKSINGSISTVAGGVHVTSSPMQGLKSEYVDFIFAGDAEIPFSQFLGEYSKNKPDFSNIRGLGYKSGRGELNFNGEAREETLDNIKMPDYNFLGLDKYLKNGYRFSTWHNNSAPIMITRGCPYTCKYCTIPLISGKKIRTHSVDYVIRWVKYLYHEKNVRMINIIDDNFTYNIKYAKKICRAIISLGFKDLRIGTPNGIRVQRTDDELMDLMKQAGWETICIAPESGSIDMLRKMKKALYPGIIYDKVTKLKQKGFRVHANFVLGYPGETKLTLRETEKMIQTCGFDFVFLNIFQPLPGTPVYNELLENKDITESTLPRNQSDGGMVYVTKGLQDFNMPLFVLSQYFKLAASNPSLVLYWYKLLGYRMIYKKVAAQVKNMIRGVAM